MPGPTLLFDALEQFLAVCRTSLDAIPAYDATLAGAPPCSYVSPGPPPWDVYPCLIVYTAGPAIADTSPLSPSLATGHRAAAFGQVNLVSITAAILRCAWQPPDDAPGEIDPDGITQTARQSSADLWAMWNGIKAAKRAGTLFAPTEREFFFDPAVAINQQGGTAGWQVNVRTELDGYSIP